MSVSLNVPVPNAVARLAADLEPTLTPFDRIRDRHTLVVKRFGDDATGGPDGERFDRLRERLRPLLADAPAFEARVTGIDYFERPPSGPGPVVYLGIGSPGLHALHRRLVEEFGAVEGMEGEAYVPHVTLARGGSVADAERLADREVDPVTWTVSELVLHSRAYREPVARLPLGG